METIETERTVLRWFQPNDVDPTLAFLGNPEVMHFSLSGPYNRKKCEEFIDWCLGRYELKGYGLSAVTLKESREVIGYCRFYDQQIDGRGEVELGCRLHPSFWNKGIGTEVALAAQNYGMILVKDSIYKDKIPVRIYSIEKEAHIKSLQTTPASRRV